MRLWVLLYLALLGLFAYGCYALKGPFIVGALNAAAVLLVLFRIYEGRHFRPMTINGQLVTRKDYETFTEHCSKLEAAED